MPGKRDENQHVLDGLQPLAVRTAGCPLLYRCGISGRLIPRRDAFGGVFHLVGIELFDAVRDAATVTKRMSCRMTFFRHCVDAAGFCCCITFRVETSVRSAGSPAVGADDHVIHHSCSKRNRRTTGNAPMTETPGSGEDGTRRELEDTC